MSERRTSRRIPITLHLSISDLYKKEQPLSGIHHLDSPIQIVDISKTGIGFISECVLPVGYFFNANLGLDGHSQDEVFTVVKIIHSRAIDRTHYRYGCEFTTQPDKLEDFIRQIRSL